MDDTTDRKQASPKVKKWVTVGVVLALVGGLTAYSLARQPDSDSAGGAEKAAQTESQFLIRIDDETVTDTEIAGLLNQGVDRAIVIDRYINKVIAARLGESKYSEQAKATLQAAKREVLANMYTVRRMQELRAAIKEEEVKSFYTENIRDENFTRWKLAYYLTPDPADIQGTLAKMKAGDKDALQQLRPLAEEGDGYLAAQLLPYNLGRVVAPLKKGDFTDILPIRNGYMTVLVEDVKKQEKPTLEKVRAEIIEVLATRRFNEELEKARRKANIEIS
ncbi:MAG: peptidyl-prolyl cis-trans isomerase [Limnobacter sp.]|nr:peptidyl-prolyl cis-trans isomerase [Limnobacter sp.]